MKKINDNFENWYNDSRNDFILDKLKDKDYMKLIYIDGYIRGLKECLTNFK